MGGDAAGGVLILMEVLIWILLLLVMLLLFLGDVADGDVGKADGDVLM